MNTDRVILSSDSKRESQSRNGCASHSTSFFRSAMKTATGILSSTPIQAMRSINLKTLLLGSVLLATTVAPNVNAQVIRLISAPGKFYVDDKSGNGIVYNYA